MARALMCARRFAGRGFC
jgi:hypothetical protein